MTLEASDDGKSVYSMTTFGPKEGVEWKDVTGSQDGFIKLGTAAEKSSFKLDPENRTQTVFMSGEKSIGLIENYEWVPAERDGSERDWIQGWLLEGFEPDDA